MTTQVPGNLGVWEQKKKEFFSFLISGTTERQGEDDEL